MRVPRSIEIRKMGILNYSDALKLQEKLTSDRKLNKIIDTLVSLQHPPTYTIGKRRTDHNILISECELRSMGAELHYTQRGGDVTFHGPRQAILYPIISLRDFGIGARKYVENLELTMIQLASLYGVRACVGRKCETGVWVGDRKIGAIGVRISSGITSHGLAFNIDPDLSYFKHIVPCGIADKEVTSLQREVKHVLPSEELKCNTTSAFGESSSPAFGTSSTSAFGVSTSPFGSLTPAFGTSPTPASPFGATGTPAFGATGTSGFGATTTIPAFGASTTPGFNFGSSPASGQSTSTFGSSTFGTTSSFGAQSSPFGKVFS